MSHSAEYSCTRMLTGARQRCGHHHNAHKYHFQARNWPYSALLSPLKSGRLCNAGKTKGRHTVCEIFACR
jgi:hypothetical protein